jgi:hypothetical protein
VSVLFERRQCKQATGIAQTLAVAAPEPPALGTVTGVETGTGTRADWLFVVGFRGPLLRLMLRGFGGRSHHARFLALFFDRRWSGRL